MKTNAFRSIGVIVFLAAVVAAGCHIHMGGDRLRAKYDRSEDLTASLADIATLDVTTNVGRIDLTAADVPEVRISAAIKVKADTEEKAQELCEGVRIQAEASGHTLVVKAIKPSGFGNNELSVDFTITAPAALATRLETNVGDVHVAGFTGSTEARANVGTITCTGLRGDASLHANVGDVRAEYVSDAPAAISFDASADVGNVELTGPKDISAKVTAETNVGSINSDRPLTVTGSLKQSIRASLGNGDGQIRLRSNVGSIHIR
jgi:hypothetical protein